MTGQISRVDDEPGIVPSLEYFKKEAGCAGRTATDCEATLPIGESPPDPPLDFRIQSSMFEAFAWTPRST